jgi:hypothetical protein
MTSRKKTGPEDLLRGRLTSFYTGMNHFAPPLSVLGQLVDQGDEQVDHEECRREDVHPSQAAFGIEPLSATRTAPTMGVRRTPGSRITHDAPPFVKQSDSAPAPSWKLCLLPPRLEALGHNGLSIFYHS